MSKSRPADFKTRHALITHELQKACELRHPITLNFFGWACKHYGFACPSAEQVDRIARGLGMQVDASLTEWAPAPPLRHDSLRLIEITEEEVQRALRLHAYLLYDVVASACKAEGLHPPKLSTVHAAARRAGLYPTKSKTQWSPRPCGWPLS